MPCQNQAQVIDLDEYRAIRQVVQANIKAFIKNGTPEARHAMHTIINAVMSNHNRNRMTFGSFEVIRNDDFGITIRARRHSSRGDRCPACGVLFRERNTTLIQVQEEGPYHDLVAYGCRRCGEIFSRVEYTGGDLDA